MEFLRFIFFSVGKMEKLRNRSLLSLPCKVLSLCVDSSGRTFGRSQGVAEMCKFYPVDTVEYLINLQ